MTFLSLTIDEKIFEAPEGEYTVEEELTDERRELLQEFSNMIRLDAQILRA